MGAAANDKLSPNQCQLSWENIFATQHIGQFVDVVMISEYYTTVDKYNFLS